MCGRWGELCITLIWLQFVNCNKFDESELHKSPSLSMVWIPTYNKAILGFLYCSGYKTFYSNLLPFA